MTQISNTQEFALRFNEEEAIWQRFREKHLSRRVLEADSPLPESLLDHFDWLEAEREIRTTRVVAKSWRESLHEGKTSESGADRGLKK